MAEAVDYFSNHRLKLRFPWRLYHAPIVRELARALEGARGGAVLNVGSGPFFELERLPDTGARFTLADIDSRAVEMAKSLHGSRVERAETIEPNAPLPLSDGAFDLVVSMDVIEHVPEPAPWVRDVARVIRPGGSLFLTTPNYGFSTLGLLERTALEVVARAQGFSRKDLHPSKFNRTKLANELKAAGLVDVKVQSIAFGWVLAATAKKPRT